MELTSALLSSAEFLPSKKPTPELPVVTNLVSTGASCLVTGSAQTLPAAFVSLTVDAPCLPNARFNVHHQGMMFTAATDDDGHASLSIPALASDAIFIMSFQQGAAAVVTAQVANVEKYDRMVLQWHGETGFELHARDFGATYGEDGHIRSGAEQTLSSLIASEKGFVHRLGLNDGGDGSVAEVYTYPVGSSQHVRLIDVSAEAQVSMKNCGRNITAQSLEQANGVLRKQDLTLSVPPCDTVGSYMVLNNLVSDLKVAAK
ncbi:MAG: hypothetical protein ABJM43_11490 [Paracoccaceae bacterium]